MNIEPYIREVAKALELSFALTGGGCDFVVKRIGSTELVLGDEHLESPQSLGEKGIISFYKINDEGGWSDNAYLTMEFKDVIHAMLFMHNVEKIA